MLGEPGGWGAVWLPDDANAQLLPNLLTFPFATEALTALSPLL